MKKYVDDDVPNPNYIDMVTGYSLSIPLHKQMCFKGELDEKEYAQFLAKRVECGVEGIIDFPDSKP